MSAGGDVNVIRKSVELVLAALIHSEATRDDRVPSATSDNCTNQCNAYATRRCRRRWVRVELQIAKRCEAGLGDE